MAEEREIRPSLAHDASPDAFASAMVKCQGYPPSCSDLGECSYGGDCFTTGAAGFRRARSEIDALIKAEDNTATRVWLRLAIDALDHHQFLTRGAIDALKVVAINRTVRQQYAAPDARSVLERDEE